MQRSRAYPVQYVGIVVVSVCAVALLSYIALKKYKALPTLVSYASDAHMASCANTPVVKKENPNKMLFVTCGGFLQ